jgi:protein-tyrosine-phosphatase
MAEHLLRRRLGSNSGWKVCSAGLSAGSGMPASRAAVEALKELRTTISSHQSRPMSDELAEEATLIVAMTASHREQVQTLFPRAADKTYLLKSFDPSAPDADVEDPIGSSAETYCQIRDTISGALPGLVSYMKTFTKGVEPKQHD